ncbi:MAG: hypothetical protein ACFFAS_00350 [Promethearchaeota archaeon]
MSEDKKDIGETLKKNLSSIQNKIVALLLQQGSLTEIEIERQLKSSRTEITYNLMELERSDIVKRGVNFEIYKRSKKDRKGIPLVCWSLTEKTNSYYENLIAESFGMFFELSIPKSYSFDGTFVDFISYINLKNLKKKRSKSLLIFILSLISLMTILTIFIGVML